MHQDLLEPVQCEPIPVPSSLERRARRLRLRVALVCVDLAMLLLATFATTLLRFGTLAEPVAITGATVHLSYGRLGVMVAFIWMPFLAIERLYDLDRLFWGASEFSRLVRAVSLGIVGFILMTYLLKLPGFSRSWVLLAWSMAIVALAIGRLIMRSVLRRLRTRGRLLKPTLIVGSNEEAERIVRILDSHRSCGLKPIGYVASTPMEFLAGRPMEGLPPLGMIEDVADVVAELAVDTIVFVSSACDQESISRMLSQLRNSPVDMHISSGLFEILTSRILLREIGGVPLMMVKSASLSKPQLAMKRAFDIAISLTAVVVGMPLWLLVALLIKLDSRGPVLYRQARVGHDGKAFGIYKFRSMTSDAEACLEQLLENGDTTGPMFKMRDDPRVTRVGRWLRKHSIDEFPQLLNVLKGEMSLVGPRPPLIQEADHYTDHHWRRLEVRPGMTGLWQVSGRSNLSFEEMVRLDLLYIENWTLRMDLVLLLRTLPAVIFSNGAY